MNRRITYIMVLQEYDSLPPRFYMGAKKNGRGNIFTNDYASAKHFHVPELAEQIAKLYFKGGEVHKVTSKFEQV